MRNFSRPFIILALCAVLGAGIVSGSVAHAQAIGGATSNSIGGATSNSIGGATSNSIGGATGCTSSGNPSQGLTNPLQAQCLQTLIQEIVNVIMVIGSMFLTLMLIYTGFLFVQARGNQEKLSSARTALLWTVIGGLILLGASLIAQAIAATASSL